MIVRAIRSELAFYRLRRQGQVVPGEVIGAYTELTGQQETETVLTYAFASPDGEPVHSAVHIPVGAISPTRLPQAGSSILILYGGEGCYKVR